LVNLSRCGTATIGRLCSKSDASDCWEWASCPNFYLNADEMGNSILVAILKYYSLAMLKSRHQFDTFSATQQVFRAEIIDGV
jgi:hypothetical protein